MIQSGLLPAVICSADVQDVGEAFGIIVIERDGIIAVPVPVKEAAANADGRTGAAQEIVSLASIQRAAFSGN